MVASGAEGDASRMILQSVAGLARTMLRSGQPGQVLDELAEQVSLLLSADGTGILLDDGDRVVSSGVSPGLPADLQAVQEQAQEGPGVDAVRTSRTVAVGDLTENPDRWPRFAEQARAADVRSVVAIPLRSGTTTIGAVTVYHSGPRTWTAARVRPAQVLSEVAAGYLLMSRRLDEQRRVTDQLQHALDTRIVIEQAKGIVAVHRSVDMNGALEILRRHANNHGATLEATADAVVRLGLRP